MVTVGVLLTFNVFCVFFTSSPHLADRIFLSVFFDLANNFLAQINSAAFSESAEDGSNLS